MAGDSVHWTPEMRRSLSEKMKAARARETPEQKAARKAKRAATMQSDPEIEKRRAAAIARTRINRKDKMSTVAREAHARKDDYAKQASLNNLKGGHGPRARQKAALSRDQSAINAKIRRAVKRNWAETSPAQKVERCRKAVAVSSQTYTLIDGSTCQFKGSWEPACANVLISLNVPYETQVVFNLDGYHYHADFVLPGNTIIEVKGNPYAWKRWRALTLPSILKHLDPKWKVYVLARHEKNTYGTLNEFLGTLDLVFGGAS